MTILLNGCPIIGNRNGIKIRDIDEYIDECFSIPEGQPLPEDHFEFKVFGIVGDFRSGKTKLGTQYLARKAYNLWGNDIDFFDGEHVYALIDAIAKSTKPVHYGLLDDQVFYLDARNPMGNRLMTQTFFTIAHELKRKSEMSGGNLGGLVIVPILVQSWRAIDLRLKSILMFTIFKGWDDSGCQYYNISNDIQEELLNWKIGSLRTDYKARTHAFVVDVKKEGSIIYFDSRSSRYKNLPFEFEKVTGYSILKEQKKEFIEFVSNFDFETCTNADLQAELYEKIDEIEAKGKCYIRPKDFREIIIRAKRGYIPGIQTKSQDKDLSDGWIKENILTLHDSLKFSFQTIEDRFGIPHSTAYDWYIQEKDKLNSLINTKNKEENCELIED